ncbi:MAG: HlyD family efflux transporter periplasmic adaptor subunit [Planctomycetota bacterium]
MSQNAQKQEQSIYTRVVAQDPLEMMVDYQGLPELFMPEVMRALCLAAHTQHTALVTLNDQGNWDCRGCHPEAIDQHPDRGAWIQHVLRAVELGMPKQACRLPLYSESTKEPFAQIVLAPLYLGNEGVSSSVLCLLIQRADEATGLAAMRHLERAVQVVARYGLKQQLRQEQSSKLAMAQAIQVLDAVNREPRFKSAAIGLCNQAADTWKASRVSIGFLMGRDIKLRAMSHTEDISRKMQLVQDLEAAMEECLDQDSEVLVPQSDTATTINRQGRCYAEKHGPCKLCLLPLRLYDRVVGAMAVEWPTDHEIRADEVEALRLTANLFTARLHQFHLDDRWLGARMATSLRETAAAAVGAKHTWAKLLAIVVCVFFVFAFFVTGNDTVDSSFTVQTTSRQVVTAPYAGTLLSVGEGVEINEPVVGSDQTGAAATVLAQLDTSELRVELSAVQAEIADFQAQADAARGENDLARVEVALANVRRLEAQADLYEYRIDRSTLTSPVSGVVIEGDLNQRVNGVLEKGEVLFEIASLDAVRAELLVPASRIGDVRSRLEHPDTPSRGELASVSHPGAFIGFTVERIEPEAEVLDGQNVFRVRVSLDEITEWLRPGVEGEAKIHVSKRSYAYLWTRDAVNWVRMKLWF